MKDALSVTMWAETEKHKIAFIQVSIQQIFARHLYA